MHNSRMETRIGELITTYTSKGEARYALDMWHDGLRKHRTIRGDDVSILKLKAQLQIDEWDERWHIIDSASRLRANRDAGKQEQARKKELAVEQTAEAQAELQSLTSLLKATLSVDDRVDWESLKDRSAFPEQKPLKPRAPLQPTLGELPTEPSPNAPEYVPTLGFLDKLVSSRKTKLLAEKHALFQADHAAWKTDIDRRTQAHLAAMVAHEAALATANEAYQKVVAAWSARKEAFFAQQSAAAAAVDAKRAAYQAGNIEAIVEYNDLVLSSSRFPDYFPEEFDLGYDAGTKTLIIDYALPSPDDLPRLRGVKYIASRDDFEEQFISDAQAGRQYDDVLYQVILRTVHEVFEADAIDAVHVVSINGIVSAIDRTTGKPVTACVLSLRADRTDFLEINLAQVDPKACFKSLKGVGSSKLHGLSAVPPIMPLRKDDGRFVSAYEVANTLDGSVNLAAMDWEDFEHLIREVFETEFSSHGGEVKVTQASRDGGVDARAILI